ncbi:PAS domain-containing protein [Rhodovibrionaceae bacterium A322]
MSSPAPSETNSDLLDHVCDPLQQAFLGCWSGFGNHARTPTRRELDPLILGPLGLLPHIWILERVDQSFAFRLMGDSIRDSWGKNLLNVRLDKVFPASSYERMFRDWNRIINDQILLHSTGRMYPTDARFRTTNRISLPLAADHSNPEGVIGITLLGPDQEVAMNQEMAALEVILEQVTLTPVANIWASHSAVEQFSQTAERA